MYQRNPTRQHATPMYSFTLNMQSFPDLKKELVRQGQKYASEVVNFRTKIAELTLGFIKDDSVVRKLS
jgi:translation initiation factor eIF-2B subunit alpha